MMPKKYLRIAIFILFAVLTTTVSASNQLIERCFTNCDATLLGTIVSDKVFYVEEQSRKLIDGSEVEAKLSSFFIKNPVASFEVVHQSRQSGVSYIIGVVTTKGGDKYRVHILSNIENNEFNITQIRIEEL